MKIKEIKDKLKKQFNFGIICIQSGKFNCFFDEDAMLMSEVFDFNIFEKGDTKVTGFPIWIPKRKYIEYFNENNISYAFLTQYKEVKDKDTLVFKRIITNSTNLDTLGIEFSNESRIKTNGKDEVEENSLELKFLEAVLKGYNPITGEVLEKDSVWKHSQITSDVEEYLSDFKISEKISQDDESDIESSDFYLLKKFISQLHILKPKLTDRELDIIKYRYGIDGGKKRTLQEVGNKFELSRERIRQILNKIIKKLNFNLNPIIQNKIHEVHNSISQNSVRQLNQILESIIESNYPKRSYRYDLDIQDKRINKDDYYKLENMQTFTPINWQLTDESKSQWRDISFINLKRNENKANNQLLNRGFPITQEEINLILDFAKKDWTLNQLEKYFQRSYKSILHIIENE